MLKKQLITFLCFILLILPTGNLIIAHAEENDISDTSTLGADYYVAPDNNETNGIDVQENGRSARATTYITTAYITKTYKNIYRVTVAKQEAVVQWHRKNGNNTGTYALWQNIYAGPLYGYSNVSNSWNYKGSSNSQANQSVKFSSGIPTPWGHVGGQQFTSRIITTVYGNGNFSSY